MFQQESVLVNRERCPACASAGMDTSKDNLAVYDDGHKYCFGCGYYSGSNGEKTVEKKVEAEGNFKVYHGSITPITDRMINKETVQKYGYETTVINEKRVEIASFFKDGKVVAQHLRGPEKKFHWTGNTNRIPLWGQHLWTTKGKRLVITEGEYDCMTVSQLFNNRWPVVSLPSGAQSAVRAIKDNLEWVSSHDEIVLMFDMDDAGQQAAVKVAEILPPGRVKIAALPYKDANECLVKGSGKEVVNSVFQAQRYSPDEIVHVADIVEAEDLSNTKVYPFPFQTLTDFLIGQRSGEITLWCSGTGSGKSTILRELMIDHLKAGRSVGAIMLEEAPQETMDDMISLMINKPVRAQKAQKIMHELRIKMGKEDVGFEIMDNIFSEEEYTQAKKDLCDTNLYIYDHLGNSALTNLIARMEFMAVSLEVDVIVLDHITAAAAGLIGNSGDVDGGSSERLIIDNIMKEMRSLVSRTGVRVEVVSQLKKTSKAYEEGDRITLQDLRGSGSLSSVPNTVVALERDRQNPDVRIANTTTIRVLKNRLTGKAGIASCLYYDHSTGRTKEIDFAIDDGGRIELDPNA
jgi:twinkle protein